MPISSLLRNAQAPSTNSSPLQSATTEEQAAYILYTSGSTGKPKGVCVGHRALCNFLLSMKEKPGFTEEDVLCAITTFTFDISLLELLLPLVVGGKIVIASEEEVLNPKELIQLMKREGATYLQATPSYWRTLFRAGLGTEDSISLTPLCGGEALAPDLLQQFIKKFSGVWNLYGPTETTVWSTCAYLTATDYMVHVGKPIAKTSIWILDEELSPVPEGESGGIFIGGEGVALGYWKRPELTQKRFLPNPFSNHASGSSDERIYDTGDLGRFDAEGNLVHLGRTDDQVKIRGFRVELGEIEHCLVGLQGVEEAAVSLKKRENQADILCAYFVGTAQPEIVKVELEKILPAYMIPQFFTKMSSLPRTMNDKLDRNALPLPKESKISEGESSPRRDELESRLASLWSEVLDVKNIHQGNSFFSLGGTSLIALELLSRLESDFHCTLRYLDFISCKTFHDFTEAVRKHRRQEGDPTLSPSTVWGGPQVSQESPLTRHQSAMLYLEELVPDSAVYNIPFCVEFPSTLDEEILLQSLSHIVFAIPALRVQILEKDGGQRQWISDNRRPHLEIHTQAINRSSLQDILGENAKRRFALRGEPLYRFDLFTTEDGARLLLATFHHLIFDGWSWLLFLDTLVQTYEAKRNGTRIPEFESANTSLDLATLQQRELSPEWAKRMSSFWTSRMEGSPHLIELPNELPRPEIFDFRGTRTQIDISEASLQKASKLASELSVSLPSLFLAAFHLTLSGLVRTQTLSIALPMRVVPNAGFQHSIGCFINALPIRFSTDAGESIEAVIQKTHREIAEILSERNSPFEAVLETLRIPHPPQYPPIAQAFLTFEDLRGRTSGGSTLPCREHLIFQGSCETELNLWCRWLPEGFFCALDSARSLFSPDQAKQIAAIFQHILEQVLDSPTTLVRDLSLIPESERPRLQTLGNGPEKALPSERIQDRILKQASSLPDGVAVISGGDQQSYAELAECSARVARSLLHFPKGGTVAVSLARNTLLPGTLLGILRAGMNYLPIDPYYPEERRAFLLEDAKPAAVIVSPEFLESWGSCEIPVLNQEAIPSPQDNCQSGRGRSIDEAFDPESAAYLLYTSGSTGKPKGVLVPHRSVVNFLRSMAESPGLHQDDVILALTNITFDISVLEIFLPLSQGATLVLASDAEVKDPAQILRLIEERNISLVQATPSTWHLLNRSGIKRVARPLRKLIGGEALTPEMKSELLSYPGELWNMYGPTETTVWSTGGKMDASSVHIGAPIQNTQLFVVDHLLRPLPIGFPGELLIGGKGLAIGYLNREELTVERFPANHLDTHGPRVYRTGDLARFTSSGRLEHLGRIDFQVKLRGHRIELGEIESVLEQLLQVGQAICIVHSVSAEDKRLIAYYTLKTGAGLTQSEARDHLRKNVPPFMIPQHFVELDVFPLNSSRKVDRKLLPLPREFSVRVNKSEPVSPNEIYLASLWSHLLKVSGISQEDNFFELGGHSLLSLELIGIILRDRGLRLSPRVFLTNNLTQAALLLPEDERTSPEKAPPETKSNGGLFQKLKNLRNSFS